MQDLTSLEAVDSRGLSESDGQRKGHCGELLKLGLLLFRLSISWMQWTTGYKLLLIQSETLIRGKDSSRGW